MLDDKCYEEARLDSLSRHKEISKMLESEDGKKLPEKIKGVFKRAKSLYWKRAFIMNACKTLFGPNGMLFSHLEKQNSVFKDMAEDEKKARGNLFIQLHVSDLQLCNCSDLRTCKNCRECVDFLRGNIDYKELKEYVKGRMFPVGWHKDPDLEMFKNIQKEMKNDG